MRGAFGLVALLIGSFIVVYLWATSAKETLDAAKPAQQQAQQIAGRADDGRPAIDTVTLEPTMRQGKLSGLEVKAIEPEGAMAKRFGLRVGDVIIEVGPMTMQMMNDDEGLARGQLSSAFAAQSQSIVVKREGKNVTLP